MRECHRPSREALNYIKQNLPLTGSPRTATSLPDIRVQTLEMCRHDCEQMLRDHPVTRESGRIGDIDVQKVTPAGVESVDNKVLLYHFGGGFVQGSPYEDIPIIVPLACKLNIPVIATQYRLAPEHPFPAAVHDALSVYRVLLDTHGACNIAAAGESAGGNLSLAVLNQAQLAGLELPRVVSLMSPWVDLTNEGTSVTDNDGRDPSLSARSVIDAATLYAPENNHDDPAISPLFADYGSDFPPTIITTGTRDLLMSGSIEMANKLRAADVDVELRIWDELWHVFEWCPQIPEADESLQEIATFVSSHLFRAE